MSFLFHSFEHNFILNHKSCILRKSYHGTIARVQFNQVLQALQSPNKCTRRNKDSAAIKIRCPIPLKKSMGQSNATAAEAKVVVAKDHAVQSAQ